MKLKFTPTVKSERHHRPRGRYLGVRADHRGRHHADGITIPATKNRQATTTVELPAGQTLAIAGMLQDTIRQQINQLPGLGDIPILGALFRSRDFIHNQTELVILVTPVSGRARRRRPTSRPTICTSPATPRRFSSATWRRCTASATTACAAATTVRSDLFSTDDRIGNRCDGELDHEFPDPQGSRKPAEEPAGEVATGARLLPRITIQAFCEHSQTAELVEVGGARPAHVARSRSPRTMAASMAPSRATSPTRRPTSSSSRRRCRPTRFPRALDRLAEVCDASTRLIVLGHVNDVLLYRELIRSGVSEYLVLPTSAAVDRQRHLRPVRRRRRRADRPHHRLHLRQGRRRRLDRRAQCRLGHQPASAPGRADPRHGSAVRHRRPQLQPGPAARHRRCASTRPARSTRPCSTG